MTIDFRLEPVRLIVFGTLLGLYGLLTWIAR